MQHRRPAAPARRCACPGGSSRWTGRYRWAGRTDPDDAVTAAFRTGARDVTVRIGRDRGARPGWASRIRGAACAFPAWGRRRGVSDIDVRAI